MWKAQTNKKGINLVGERKEMSKNYKKRLVEHAKD